MYGDSISMVNVWSFNSIVNTKQLLYKKRHWDTWNSFFLILNRMYSALLFSSAANLVAAVEEHVTEQPT